MAAIVTKFISYIKNNKSISNYFKRTVYNLIYKPNSQIVPIKDIEDYRSNVILKLFDKGTFKSFSQKFLNTDEKYIEIKTPEISLYKFENILIDIKSSSFLFNKKLVVFRTNEERFNEGFVTVHNKNHAKVNIKSIEELKEGFFLGGNGSWNWFHFLIEIMPKMMVFNNTYCNTLLVHEIVLKTPSMKKILEIFSEDNFKIEYLNPEKNYKIKKLYHINDFNHVQFNRFDNLIKADGTFYNSELIRNFSHLILEKSLSNKVLPDKIFLYRKNTHRIATNQDEIVEYLKRYNFTLICMEELSIEEQTSYFKNAKFIIGISGAAWVNMIFCRNRPKAICFVPDNAENFTAFSNLAKISEVNLYSQLYFNDGLHSNSNFIINFDKFIELFEYVNGK